MTTITPNAEERVALFQFAQLLIPTSNFLKRLRRVVHVRALSSQVRNIAVSHVADLSIPISLATVRSVIHRYVSENISRQELSNWAGLILAIPVYVFSEADNELLELMNDVALPLNEEYLDPEVLMSRVASLSATD